ncbi:probable serine/threonine-protein kinase PBL7 [Neltuma alba]|uniref:probable serine/threonine-protein kinase PBL7 n=1 Tax=Neltuma alba TaxID=207710 RepID=UPI0010A2E577|nr:probable serine/threonine-protein kinase PBL7 [Prosopis alba]
MSLESQRVVVIQDASRDVSTSAIKKVLKQLALKPGDELTILAIFGNKIVKMDSRSFIATDGENLQEELGKIKEEYHNRPQVMKLSEYCQAKNLVFQIEVLAYPSQDVTCNAVNMFRATCLILDRHMNKDKRHCMDNLACGIYRIRNRYSIQMLRKPKLTEKSKSFAERSDHVRNMEVTPGSSEAEFSNKRTRSSSSENLMETGVSILQFESKEKGQTEEPQFEMKEELTEPLCSVCKNERPKPGCMRDFSYSELYTATKGFSQKNFLSEGGFGSVYKGQLDGTEIAVKQHKCASLQGEKEFKSEVNLLRKTRHENVVMLLGSCSEGNNRLLVYEYACNGSLDQHLSQHSRAPLRWEDRIKVATGSAKGLLYLHENNIIHRDMRTNNILLTHDHQPLLGDFGLARSQHQDSIQSTEVVGTLGYLAPEYAEYGKVSTKTDVYSFGVILLQLITGMKTTDQRLEGRSLVGWARPLLRERNYPDLIDERIMNSHDYHQLFWMVRIAEKCLSRDPHKRLNMGEVVDVLTQIAEGKICGNIKRDYFPVRSDSLYSTSDEGEEESSEDEIMNNEEESCSTDSSSSVSQMGLGLSNPPSPPPMEEHDQLTMDAPSAE